MSFQGCTSRKHKNTNMQIRPPWQQHETFSAESLCFSTRLSFQMSEDAPDKLLHQTSVGFSFFSLLLLEFNSPWFIHINKEAPRGLSFICTINVWPRELFGHTLVARKVKPKTWVVPFMQILLNENLFHIQITAQAYSEYAYVVI